MCSASLLLAYLYDTIVFISCFQHGIAFFKSTGNRLFNIYIFSSLASLYHLQSVPVVRCGNNDRVDVFSFVYFSKIREQLRHGSAYFFYIFTPFFQYILINVAKRYQCYIRNLQVRGYVFEANAIDSYGRDTNFIARTAFLMWFC